MKKLFLLAFIFIFYACKKPTSKEKFETGESAGEYTPEASISIVKEVERVQLNGYRYFLLEIDGQLIFGSNDSWVVVHPNLDSECYSD